MIFVSASSAAGRWSNLRRSTAGIRPFGTKIAYVPLKLMAARNGASLKLGDALKRLRCDRCGGEPVSASLTDHTNDGDQGGQRSSWS
jgi:hypothetical protein